MFTSIDKLSPVSSCRNCRALRRRAGIAFKGPAIYANLVIANGKPSSLPNVKPAAVDSSAVTNWRVAPPSTLAVDKPVPAANIPMASAWGPVAAEANGLVNLSRAFGTAHAPATSIGWLKTIVAASAPLHRTIRIGWARQVTVFLNGKAVFAGDNPYYPSERRLSPNGRLEPDNALIPLDLHQGANEIVLAVGNGWRTQAGFEKAGLYGWAAEAHFDDLAGLILK